MNKYFPSARSTALGIFIWGVLLIVFVLSFNAAFKNPNTSDILILLAFWILIFIFMGSVWFRTGYFVADQKIIVKIGPIIHCRIDIDKITDISKTNSWLSAPANSLNRLAIKSYDKMLVMVSPKDQKLFIETLKSINPCIKSDL